MLPVLAAEEEAALKHWTAFPVVSGAKYFSGQFLSAVSVRTSLASRGFFALKLT